MISAGCIRAATSRYESLKTPAARKPPSVGNGSHARRLRFSGYCGLNTAVSEPVWTIIQIGTAPKRAEFNPPCRTVRCITVQWSAWISWSVRSGRRGDSRLWESCVRKGGTASRVRKVHPILPQSAARREFQGASRGKRARSADAAIGFHPSEFALHRLRPTQPAARHGWRAPASGSRRLQGHAATPPSVAM